MLLILFQCVLVRLQVMLQRHRGVESADGASNVVQFDRSNMQIGQNVGKHREKLFGNK